MTASPRTVGVASGIYALFSALIVLAEIPLAFQQETLLMRASIEPTFGRWLSIAALAIAVLLLLSGLSVALLQRARTRHSHGRARLLLAGVGGVIHAVGGIALAVSIAGSTSLEPLGDRTSYGAAVVWSLGGLLTLVTSATCFTLLSTRARTRIWIAVDVLLLAAVSWALLALPAQPASSTSKDVALPVLRHVLTTLGVLRLLVRLLPVALSAVEARGFKALVAARHLRSKKSGFLAAISLLSVLAVCVSCMALTTTLSVMGGFRNDLKRKILGSNAHIVIDREHDHIEDWRSLLHTFEGKPGITGAAAYVSGEVMLSSASNLATAVLRGIEPERIGKVNDLPKNLKSGSLDYLLHPEKLLTLPPDTTRGLPLLLGDTKLTQLDAGTSDATNDAGVTPDASSPLDQAAAKKAELEKRITAIETFLRDVDRPARNPALEQDRKLLPGIIIGQELARALRLYVGDEVNVVAPLGALGPTGPMPKARPFRVAGIFYSGMYEYDMKFTYVALPAAQKFLGTGDTISGFEVRVKNLDLAPTIAMDLRKSLGADRGLRVRDWQELNSRLFGALALEKLAMFIALGIAILVASFCIAGTLTLMVQEKGREVAILKAMGASDRTVVGVFLIEGELIGLLGTTLGLFLGYMLCFAAEHFGIRMNPEVYYIDRLPVHVDVTEFALVGIVANLVCLVITIYPALLASRLRPLDALRYE